MKSLFRGSVVIAATILSASFLLSARQSTAETLLSSFQTPKQEQGQAGNRQDPKGPAGLEVSAKVTSSTDGTTSIVTENTAKTAPANESGPARSASKTPVTTVAPIPTGILVSGSDSSNTPAIAGAAYTATAYSLSGRTASGLRVSKGLIAADPRVLPLGTRVRLEAGAWSGEYLVADTGGAVRGKRIDIWTSTSREAFHFGRRLVKLTVLSYPAKRASTLRHRKR